MGKGLRVGGGVRSPGLRGRQSRPGPSPPLYGPSRHSRVARQPQQRHRAVRSPLLAGGGGEELRPALASGGEAFGNSKLGLVFTVVIVVAVRASNDEGEDAGQQPRRCVGAAAVQPFNRLYRAALSTLVE